MSFAYKFYLYAKDINGPKYQFFIRNREDAGMKHLNGPSAFIEYSQCMDEVFNNIDGYNPTKTQQVNLINLD